MFYKKSVYRSFLLVTSLGLAIVAPIILCIYIAYLVKRFYGLDIFFVAIILGILSGMLSAYKSISSFLKKEKEEDKEILDKKAGEVEKKEISSPKKKSRIFKED